MYRAMVNNRPVAIKVKGLPLATTITLVHMNRARCCVPWECSTATLLCVQVMAADGLQGQAEFDTEARLLSRLSHGHLVRLLGVCRSTHPPLRCLLYELMPGGNVEEQLGNEVGSWDEPPG